MGLELNEAQTKYMTLDRGTVFTKIVSAIWVGTVFKRESDVSEEIEARMITEKKCE